MDEPPTIRVDSALRRTPIYGQLMLLRQRLQPDIELYVTPSWMNATGHEWIDNAWDWAEQKQKVGPFLFTTAHKLKRYLAGHELTFQHYLLCRRNRARTKAVFQEMFGRSVHWDRSERRAVTVTAA